MKDADPINVQRIIVRTSNNINIYPILWCSQSETFAGGPCSRLTVGEGVISISTLGPIFLPRRSIISAIILCIWRRPVSALNETFSRLHGFTPFFSDSLGPMRRWTRTFVASRTYIPQSDELSCWGDGMEWNARPEENVKHEREVRYVLLGGRQVWLSLPGLHLRYTHSASRSVMPRHVRLKQPRGTYLSILEKNFLNQWLPPSAIVGSSLLFTARNLSLFTIHEGNTCT